MIIVCKESQVDKLTEDLATKAGTVAGYAAGAVAGGGVLAGILGAALARKLMKDRIMFNRQLKQAKAACPKFPLRQRQICIRKAMAAFYANMGKQYNLIAQKAMMSGKHKLAAGRYAKKAKYYLQLSKALLNPQISIKDARKAAKRAAKLDMK